MGNCHSEEVSSLSSGRSLPPTKSFLFSEQESSGGGSPPQRSLPQSPDIEEVKKSMTRLPVFSESIEIDVIDIPSKLIQCESTTSTTSPAAEVQQLEMANNNNEPKPPKNFDFGKLESIPQMAIRNEDKIETSFKNTLRMVFVCYLVVIVLFCRMCNNAFNEHGIVSNAVVNMNANPVLAKETPRKERFDFLREMKQLVAFLREFSIYQDFVSLLPLSSVKQLLSLSGREQAFATIHVEWEEIMVDNVLI